MTSISALENIHKKGLFGDHEDKNENKLIKIQERKNLLIVQIVQYKNSSVLIKEIDIDGLNLTNEAQKVISNDDTRILWCGPKNWLLVSTKKDLFTNIKQTLKEMDFAVTNLSHSRAIIELDGENSIEVLKKGCPFNFSELKKNNCVNSAFHGITITVDMIDDDPNKIRLFALRSFGESLYHSITDASLEFGYKAI
jgi:sarcosine oxidase subunit gamma